MRKNFIYLLILAILGFSVYFFLIRKNENSFGQAEAGFTFKDTAAIGRIFLSSNDGQSILAERTDSGWMVNKKWKALPSTLNQLMLTLYQQEPLYPVVQTAFDNVIKSLATDAIKVELYARDGQPIRTFYVGGPSVNNTGTNMLIKGATTPYVVHIQGFNGYLTPRYTARMNDWRDRSIINLPPDEIKSISLDYAGKPVNSFVLSRDNGQITVSGDEGITKNLGALNMRRANVYLKYFGNINCEGYLNGLADMDSTLKTAPKRCVLEVTGMHGQHQHVDIYWMALNKRSKNVNQTDEDVPDDYDADRMYAVINNNRDTVMIQQFVFKNIFRKAFEFFQADAPSSNVPAKPELPKNVLMHKNG